MAEPGLKRTEVTSSGTTLCMFFLDRALPLVESLLQSISTYCLSVIVEVTSRFNVVINVILNTGEKHLMHWALVRTKQKRRNIMNCLRLKHRLNKNHACVKNVLCSVPCVD